MADMTCEFQSQIDACHSLGGETVADSTFEVTEDFPFCIDLITRHYQKGKLGVIRNVNLHSLIFTGKERCIVSGHKKSPVENLTMQNITWNVTGLCDFENAEKPWGTVKQTLDPDLPNLATQPYQFIFSNINRLSLDTIVCRYAKETIDRNFVYMNTVNNAQIETSEFSDGNDLEKSILTENCTNVNIT